MMRSITEHTRLADEHVDENSGARMLEEHDFHTGTVLINFAEGRRPALR
jgi:hypothetical protein